jgi:arginyl-tRNA synthetase
VKSAIDILNERIGTAMVRATGREDCAAIVRSATDPRFGDYQANGVMALAKQIKTNPRKLAEEVVAQLDLGDICEPPEIAGPGFINLRLRPEHVAGELLRVASGERDRLGVEETPNPQTVVVDFSSPNIAKEMFVGHLRSTIIGDAICRLLEFLGHKVIRQNHLGDWGRQFGLVILGLWHICMEGEYRDRYWRIGFDRLREHFRDREQLWEIISTIRDRHKDYWEEDHTERPGDGKKRFAPWLKRLRKREPEDIWGHILQAYQFVNMIEDCAKDLEIRIRTWDQKAKDVVPINYELLSRHITAMLQTGGEENRQERLGWRVVRRMTVQECNTIYQLLSVTLTDRHIRAESAYKRKATRVVTDLSDGGLAVESNGAVCVFPEGFKTKEGEPLPFIIQKSDGAYLYATTDLAALRYRVNVLKADRIVYVTDARQIQHFQMLFKVAEMAGWNQRGGKTVELVHVTFGSVLGEDGRPLKTRSGENVKLKDLLDEAVERARAVVQEKNPELPPEQKAKIAEAVGIGAVKYADYSNNRTSDYVFSFDKMLAMDGNTAPYMQYAYARVKSIERKAESKGVNIREELRGISNLDFGEPTELDLGKHLVRYAETIESAVADYRPNYLTAYLYELAQKFSAFYTECPVLDAPPAKRPTRLLLCDLTAKTIQHGLSQLLGIQVVEQM